MAEAVWMITYDLDPERADEYLCWFHEVHIAEKLARPGYTWAAHYRAFDSAGAPAAKYVAMFGGTDSRVFYDPSPAQIKPRQSPQTRAMMACRSGSQMLILAAEWSAGADGGSIDIPVSADRIELAFFDANQNDEQLGAWLAQEYLAEAGKCGVTRKYLASTGAVRHVLLHESAAGDASAGSPIAGGGDDWAEQVAGYLSYPLGAPFSARRAWPPAG